MVERPEERSLFAVTACGMHRRPQAKLLVQSLLCCAALACSSRPGRRQQCLQRSDSYKALAGKHAAHYTCNVYEANTSAYGRLASRAHIAYAASRLQACSTRRRSY